MNPLDIRPFINQSFPLDFCGTHDFSIDVTENTISFNEMIFVNRTNKGIFIELPFTTLHKTVMQVLMIVLCTKDINIKNGTIFINGIEWDTKKVNINLFC